VDVDEKARAIETLWRAGRLRWKLDKNQKGMYDAFLASDSKKFVWYCSRRIGKSYALCIVALEYALQHPNAQIKYAAPTAKMVRKIIRPLIRQILGDCPKDLKPRENKLESEWEFPNGSCITIAGCDQGNAESLRGQGADLCILDEAGFIDDLLYVTNDILLAQLLDSDGRILFSTTPPRSPDHEFAGIREQAIRDGAFVKRTIYDNPRLTPEKIKRWKKEAGGEDSTTWRREYLVEDVIDSDSAVIPEFTKDVETSCVHELERPEFFDAYASFDIGYVDAIGGLFAYWDFEDQWICIEDEILMFRANTEQFVSALKTTEKALWGDHPVHRYSDVEPRLLSDLRSQHKIHITQTRKDDKDSAIAHVRTMIAAKRVRIHPRCKNLIHQLKSAIWNKARTDFERTTAGGHFDLVDALVYLVRNVNRNRNPIPANHGLKRSTHHFREQSTIDASLAALKKAFETPKRQRARR
jgi:hypothetical protein